MKERWRELRQKLPELDSRTGVRAGSLLQRATSLGSSWEATGGQAEQEARGRPETVLREERNTAPRNEEKTAYTLQGPKAVKSLN